MATSLASTATFSPTGDLPAPAAYLSTMRLGDGMVLSYESNWRDDVVPTGSATYDPPTGQWLPAGNLPAGGRSEPGVLVALNNGGAIIVGGRDGTTGWLASTTFTYQPTTRTWSVGSGMVQPRRFHTATLLPDGRVLAAGGETFPDNSTYAFSSLASAELYNPADGTWRPTGALPLGRKGHGAILLDDGTVLVAGGFVDAPPSPPFGDDLSLIIGGEPDPDLSGAAVEIYNPATGQWTETGNLKEQAVSPTMVKLPNGKVLLANADFTTATQLYDPATREWSYTGSLASTHAGAKLMVLPSGKVLIAGPFPAQGLELYNPLTETWTPLGSSPNYRQYAYSIDGVSVTLLADGRVLTAGGVEWSDDGPRLLSQAELITVTEPVPTAIAGPDRSVNQAEAVTITGTASGFEGSGLTYRWEQLPGGTRVTNLSVSGAELSFTAPTVAGHGETLTFRLTVTAGDQSASDEVNISVAKANYLPVANAGNDQQVAEGSTVILDGSKSFDGNGDTLDYKWTLVGSNPAFVLTGKNPTFVAPNVSSNAGVALEFELVVSDGLAPDPTDIPFPPFTADNVRDRVVIKVTNTNNAPTANAGADQTVLAGSTVKLNGSASSDPDNDTLTYAWAKVGAPGVTLNGATPTFTAPAVASGATVDVAWDLTVNDGYGGSATDRVVIHVQSPNAPPLVTAARPTQSVLWPPNHGMVSVGITGVSDPDNNPVTITITGVMQNEPTNGLGDGDTAIDAIINKDGTVLLRAERSGKGDGRVYRVSFTANDGTVSVPGMVKVSVPKSDQTHTAVDSGASYDSTK